MPHSRVADSEFFQDSLTVTTAPIEGKIMSVKHLTDDIEAVLFHQESIMTPYGEKMIHDRLK